MKIWLYDNNKRVEAMIDTGMVDMEMTTIMVWETIIIIIIIIIIGGIIIIVEARAGMIMRGEEEAGGVEVEVGVTIIEGGIIEVGVEMIIEDTGEPKSFPEVLPGVLPDTITRGDDHLYDPIYYITIYILL